MRWMRYWKQGHRPAPTDPPSEHTRPAGDCARHHGNEGALDGRVALECRNVLSREGLLRLLLRATGAQGCIARR